MDALAAIEAGTAPRRPRNEFERQAREATRRQPGRPRFDGCRTRLAADLALYLKTLGEAAPVAVAAAKYKVNPDNVRRYARELAMGPQVTIKQRAVMGVHMPARRVPMRVDPDSLRPASEQAST